MGYSDAADYHTAMESRDSIIHGGGSLIDKARRLANWQALVDKKEPAKKQWTFGDVLHGAIGAALGVGVARGASNILGLDERLADKLETAAMGAGAAMNTGVIKWAEDTEAQIGKMNDAIPKIAQQRKHAFRLGFLKAAQDLDLLKKEAIVPVVTLNPADLAAIPRAAAKALTSTGRTLGSLAGTVDAPDETEEALTELEVEKQLLEERLARLQADRRNASLRKVLANRGA